MLVAVPPSNIAWILCGSDTYALYDVKLFLCYLLQKFDFLKESKNYMF